MNNNLGTQYTELSSHLGGLICFHNYYNSRQADRIFGYKERCQKLINKITHGCKYSYIYKDYS